MKFSIKDFLSKCAQIRRFLWIWSHLLKKSLMEKFIFCTVRRKEYARFKDNIWEADLVEMESLSSNNKNVKYLLCVIDVFIKYAWVKPLKDKQGKTVLNSFLEIVNESNCKPNKL